MVRIRARWAAAGARAVLTATRLSRPHHAASVVVRSSSANPETCAIAAAALQHTDELALRDRVGELACVAREAVVEGDGDPALVARHGLVFVLAGIEAATAWTERGRSACSVVNPLDGAPDDHQGVVVRAAGLKLRAFVSSCAYLFVYRFPKKSCSVMYGLRWTFSTNWPCGQCIEADTAWTSPSLPSCRTRAQPLPSQMNRNGESVPHVDKRGYHGDYDRISGSWACLAACRVTLRAVFSMSAI